MRRLVPLLFFVLTVSLQGFGQTWVQMQTPVTDDLQTISFNDSVGVSGGASNGVMIRYNGTGNAWYNLSPSCGNSPFVQYLEPENMYASGGSFMASSDQGATFTCSSFPTPYIYRFSNVKMLFTDAQTGFVCGHMSGTDGGGTAYSYGQILKTTNGGTAWNEALTPVYCNTCGAPPPANISNFYDIFFVSNLEGYALATTLYGTDSLYHTTDKGMTWSHVLSFSGSSMPNSIYFTTPTTYWAPGAAGILHKGIIGGTETLVPTYGSDNLTKIVFTDSLHAWMIGGNHVYRSLDGGTTWRTDTFDLNINDICMLNNNLGYVCGNGGRVYRYSCQAVTTDIVTSICQGQSYSIGNISYTSPGSYAMTLPSAGGCDSFVHLTLTVNPLPNPSVSDNDGLLSTGSFSTYQWLYNGAPVTGATGQTFSPSYSGNYTVEVTDANGCAATSSPVVATGIDAFSLQNFSLSPNPVIDWMQISMPRHLSGTVILSDMTGRKIAVYELQDEQKHSINFETISPGVYVLTIENANGSVSRKMIKQ